MAAGSTLGNVSFIFKKLYMGGQPGDLAMRDHPLFRKIRKEDGFTGQSSATFSYPIRYGNPQAVSGTFADAQTAANTSSNSYSRGVQMSAVRKRKYGVIVMDGEALASSRDDKGAFLRLVTMETDGVLEEMGDTLAFDLYRDGDGMRGRRSSEASDVITLTIIDDARNFKVGMVVVADDTLAGSSLRVGSTYVKEIDEDKGTVKLNSVAAITSFANNDYLFRIGDPGTCMEGLASHFPKTAPTSGDSFRGVDRSVDTRRLAGVRVDDTANSIEENAGLVAVRISQVGKKADSLYLNPIKFWEVCRRLNAKVEYDTGGGSADYGFEYFMVHSPAGTLRAYSDPDTPTNRGYVLNMSTLFLKHLDGLPHIISDAGSPTIAEYNSDSVEARARAWVNLICTEPGSNGHFTI